uniref:Uncharacterized protein n=1 Tax=Arundo donax TaxID=35708 RepID=A0A0A9D2G1_ARUDO
MTLPPGRSTKCVNWRPTARLHPRRQGRRRSWSSRRSRSPATALISSSSVWSPRARRVPTAVAASTARRSRWRARSRGPAWRESTAAAPARSARTCCSRWSAVAASRRRSPRSTSATASGRASWRSTWATCLAPTAS